MSMIHSFFWLKYIFYAMQFGGLSKIRTINMIQCFDWEEMTTTAQQDIHEFLRLLIDKLGQFVDGTEFKERLTQLFVGQLESTITCSEVNFEKKRSETFWDLQLPIEDDDEIFGAFRTYLQPTKIPDYEHESGKVEAIQEYKFTSLPAILHVQLRRFNFNPMTKTTSKNNKRFQFYPQLDLSIYCEDAIYTLHSILVHSGRNTSGHYMAYVCPKADGKWLKFNDETVTKCSLQDAVEGNFGNDDASTKNAYILVYIKKSCIPNILRDIILDDVISLDLIKAEMSKQKMDTLFKEKYIEVTVHTAEKLQMSDNLKCGKLLMEQRFGMTFTIAKNKSFGDLLLLLRSGFGLSDTKIGLWFITSKKYCIRSFDIQARLNQIISSVVKKNSLNLFMELLSFEEPNANIFDMQKHALIFIKEYDPSTESLTFVGHRYFELEQTVDDLRAFIRETIYYEGNDEDMAIIVETGFDENYRQNVLVDPKQLIQKFATKNVDTFSAFVTIEVLNSNRKPKYLSAFSNLQSPVDLSPVNQIRKQIVTDLDNGIIITVNHGECELFSEEFDIRTNLDGIIEHICNILSITCDCVQLLDEQNNIIEKDFLGETIQNFTKGRFNKLMRTRNQKQTGLVFSCIVIEHRENPPSDKTDLEFNTSSFAERMECESQSDSIQLIGCADAQKRFTPVPFMVKLENLHDSSDSMTLDCERGETLQSILDRFSNKVDRKLSELVFSKKDSELFEKSAYKCAIEQLAECDDADHVEIFYEVKDDRSWKRAPNKKSSPDPIVVSITGDRDTVKEHRIQFEDRLTGNCEIDLEFSARARLSAAIEQIVQVMELNRSNTHFFNSKGERIDEDMMNTTVAKFLAKNSPKIAYKLANSQEIQLQCVRPNGTKADEQRFQIDENTTVGQLCEKNCPNGLLQKVTKITNGHIVGILPAETKAVDLSSDGHEYRINQFFHGIALGKDRLLVSVSFLGNNRRKRLPILVEVSNGETFLALGLRLMQILLVNMHNKPKFEFNVDPKWTHTPENETILVAPSDLNDIPLVCVLNDI
ncbi:ubiquitin carboxyl-terminal hydrolase 7-like [Sitodiplosis mosellana]|uniref:ubiquitin carboxyl-terminal hydrolase 7-like n=1 Tax=Sitodiplosis mosellana TaxID=263140 RepID=UPI002444E70F|nr:ubiquitin carboxyl-terminal hydrolase 7-like [Sitodiplosis mosellana]